MEYMRFKLTLFLVLLSISTFSVSAELKNKIACTWDPVGKNGPVISVFSDLTPKALSWGVNLKFIPYEDENAAAEDLASGKCDIAIVTAILSRDFVPFAGTLDAIGGITSEKKLKKAIAAISSPKANKVMTSGDYEMIASLPVGSMFAYVNDRNINGIDKFLGKRIAILNGDIQTKTFAELSSAIPVLTSLSNFHHYFEQGKVDIVLMPALAYNAFELYQGLGKNGGILDIRLFYGMIQAIARTSEFPDGFGQKVRKYMSSRLGNMISAIKAAEQEIPNKYWIKTSQETKDELEHLYKDIRLTLKAKNQFNPKALSMLWKIRCHSSPQREECILPTEPAK
jgi:hypothetical protein